MRIEQPEIEAVSRPDVEIEIVSPARPGNQIIKPGLPEPEYRGETRPDSRGELGAQVVFAGIDRQQKIIAVVDGANPGSIQTQRPAKVRSAETAGTDDAEYRLACGGCGGGMLRPVPGYRECLVWRSTDGAGRGSLAEGGRCQQNENGKGLHGIPRDACFPDFTAIGNGYPRAALLAALLILGLRSLRCAISDGGTGVCAR